MNVRAALDLFDQDLVRVETVLDAEHSLDLADIQGLWSKIHASADDLERLELAADLDGRLGESPWGLAVDSVADAYLLANEPDLARELRLRALSRTPRWDPVLAGRQLKKVADMLAESDPTVAEELVKRAESCDPTLRPGPVELSLVAPREEREIVDLLIHEEYSHLFVDHLARPRRIALVCASRGEPGMGVEGLAATRKWHGYQSDLAVAVRLGTWGSDAADCNTRLLAALEATPQAQSIAKLKRAKTPNAYKEREYTRVNFYAELAAKGEWALIHQALLSWRRQCRLAAAALLVLEKGDAVATEYVERSAAVAARLGGDGLDTGNSYAYPRLVLARRGGEAVTWEGCPSK